MFLNIEKILKSILFKYLNLTNIFLKNFAIILYKYIDINKYTINLKKVKKLKIKNFQSFILLFKLENYFEKNISLIYLNNYF